MTRLQRISILVCLVAAVGAPLLTAHALLTHLGPMSAAYLYAAGESPGVAAMFAMLALGTLPVAGVVWFGGRWLHATRRLAHLTESARSAELRGISYRRIDSTALLVFAVGIWRPQVYATAGAEQTLDDDQLHAALLHEEGHIARGDTRWRVALLAARSAFWFAPGFRRSLTAIIASSEFLADAHALNNGACRRELFEAILTAASPAPARSSGLSGGPVSERLALIVSGNPAPRLGVAKQVFAVPLSWVALPVFAHLVVMCGVLCGGHP
ncbi:MAG: M56 family metallopeptidase [bacterium]